ncbi:NTP transferase domain-containing protein [Mycobacterium yunnanensis]|uniref:NTP transferase domain-containing protein n=1 Tax=Mycobacterium yunnanensis TaxID=368477 RepID=A0A9X2YM75_9MYCO|nr:NTP transferase domain-containing protein [Mycobacterium yunnanensis]MCV7421947.1 NTP transferase domain-containing protein [Mycobacterium yunnanensis]
MSKAPSVAGVLLAAGAGTRYGMPKVLAQQGEWLRLAVAALADGGCDDVVVVLGAAVVDVPPPARAVVAPDWASGMGASLRTGLAAANAADLVVVHLVDVPDVGADVVTRVLAAAVTSDSGLARATFAGRPGHPVAMAGRHRAALSATLAGDEGARTFLKGMSGVAFVECGDLATGADVDRR